MQGRGCLRSVDGKVSLVVSPTMLSASGSPLSVTWNLDRSTQDGWMGVYSPADADDSEYLDYVFEHLLPEGSFVFTLVNTRSDYEVRLFRRQVCVATSDTITFELGKREPTNGHLQVAGRWPGDTGMRVQWTSGIALPTPSVQWGFAADTLDRIATANGSSTTYTNEDMCGLDATIACPTRWYHPGFFHDVLLDDLPGNTDIFYRYGQGDVYSEGRLFLSPPSGMIEDDWTFIGYGDQGVHADSFPGGSVAGGVTREVVSLMDPALRTNQMPRLLVHFGDLAYASSSGINWEVWQHQQKAVAEQLPYMVSVGNHEYDHTTGASKDPSGAGIGFHPSWGNYREDSSNECGVPVVHRFPNPPPTGLGIFWYSFDYANVHMVMLSSEHNLTTGSKQLQWLSLDLAAVDRKLTPWVIVTMHRPAYNSQQYTSDRVVGQHIASHLDPVLLNHGVNLVLSGHYHSYHRSCAVTSGRCQASGAAPVHITVGTAGYELYNADLFHSEWCEKFLCTFGFLKVKVRGASNLTVQFWGQAIPGDPGTWKDLDEVVLFPYHAVHV